MEAEAGPGRYRLRSGVGFTTSHQSPKNYLHPPRQVVVRSLDPCLSCSVHRVVLEA
ncbi:hypothetical protein WLZ34_06700 [Thermogladius sp. KZ2Tp1]|uniref:hypothetical protein n=1 Tax=Thermogladius sp. KZ2Tp1 TaxID=3136289 RepID=UPI003DA94647